MVFSAGNQNRQAVVMPVTRLISIVICTAFPVAVGHMALAENWPQWRGPRFDGTSLASNLPTTWSREENVLWRMEMPGPAASTPVVWGDRIFLTSTKKGTESLVVLSLDRSGKLQWSYEVGHGTQKLPNRLAHETTPASPSPVTDGRHVWTLFGTGTLVKLNYSGDELWRVDLVARYGRVNNYFGLSMSPLLYEKRLVLQLLHTDAQLIVALDAATGEETWKQERPTNARQECRHSYASPTPLIPAPGVDGQVLIHGADYITGHRILDGEEVWRYGTINPADSYNPSLRLVSTPIAVEGLVIVPTAKRGPVYGLRPGDFRGSIAKGTEQFVWELERGTPDVPSPLVFGGLVYLSGERGTLTVLDLDSGEVVYDERVHQSTHRGSPVHADGKIFLVGTDGTVSVIRPGRKFEVLAKNELGERLSASPAISGDTIYLRTYEALYAIGQSGDTTEAAP